MSDDDEVVDFGKLFRKKKKEGSHEQKAAPENPVSHTLSHEASTSHHTEHQAKEIEKEDEVITLEKVKWFFKGKGAGKSDETLEFEWKNHIKWILPSAIILFVFIFAFYIRAQTVNLPATDTWAENSVYNFYRNQIEDQINQQFPNLPPENKNTLIERDLQNILEENKDLVKQQLEATSQQYKDQFRDSGGETYLLGIDPWYYYRQSRNILEYGNVGTEIRDGRPFDSYKPAPEGSFIEANLHPYVGVVLFKVMSIFSNVSLRGAFFYVGAFIAALSTIPAFFIARRIGGNVGGFFASMFLAVNIFFVSRTAGESSDTDAYNVFLPLLLAWVFIEAIMQKNWKKQLGLMVLTGFLVGLYAFTWTGWWFILYLFVGTLVVQLLYFIIRESLEKKKLVVWVKYTKENLLMIVTLLLSSAIFTSLFVGSRQVTRLLARPFQFLQLKEVATTKIWPNVLTTVAELNPASLDSVVGQLGGYFLLTISIVGIFLTLKEVGKDDWLRTSSLALLGFAIGLLLWYSWASRPAYVLVAAIIVLIASAFGLFYDVYQKGLPKFTLTYFVLFGLWLGITLWSTKSGVRFTLLIVPALAMGAGFFCGELYNYLTKLVSKGLHVGKHITKVVFFILLLVLLIFPNNHLARGYQQGRGSVPSMNDAWYDSLTKIQLESEQDAIITSWWDFGHWFKAIADRPVTFDGGSQNRPQAHWVGKLLLTRDEKVSFGILRMLDCGANTAFDEVDAALNDIPESIDLINEVIVEDKNGAAAVLRNKGFDESKIETILENTHCTPPEGFVIASDDMVGKGGVWGHFGAWNFNRAEMVFKTRKLGHADALDVLMSDFNISKEEAEKTYGEIMSEDPNRWISPWPGYIGGLQSCTTTDETITCLMGSQVGEFPLVINRATMDAVIPTDQEEPLHPNTLVFVQNGKVEIREYDSPTIGFSIMLIPSGDGFSAMLADPLQAGSIFSQMYFYEGSGLQCYKVFDSRRQISGGRIYVYKVDWDCEF